MRASGLAMAALVGIERKTITGLLVTTGQQFEDCSAAYRLFSKERFDPEAVFAPVIGEAHDLLPADAPFVATIDDTLLPKSGRKVHGAAYRRDPLGPKFRVNLRWAQRFIQMAVALPTGADTGAVRTVPIDFHHAPSPPKANKDATPEQRQAHKAEQKKTKLCQVAVERMHHVRAALDALPEGRQRYLWLVGDGGYTNKTVLRQLPERTVYTGRVRQDACLHYLPEPAQGKAKGRNRVYGEQAPTPEQLRKDAAVPWQTVRVWAAGKWHTTRIKTLSPLRSRMAGKDHLLRLIVIEPLGYRLHKGGKLLYRKPAYLICTDLATPCETVVQRYIWRWEIEVNHRDEKTVLGLGQAQVRHPASAARVPAFFVACYAMALLAAHHLSRTNPDHEVLPRPVWQKKGGNPGRPSFQRIVQSMRAALWAPTLGIDHFSEFVTRHRHITNAQKYKPDLADAVLYASS